MDKSTISMAIFNSKELVSQTEIQSGCIAGSISGWRWDCPNWTFCEESSVSDSRLEAEVHNLSHWRVIGVTVPRKRQIPRNKIYMNNGI